MVYRLLENLLARLLHRQAGKTPKCPGCKTAMDREEEPPIFLLPLFFDEAYTPSPAYYEANCTPIRSRADIPTGQRACRIWTLTCPGCGQRSLLVEDFLPVRDTEVIEQRCLYDWNELNLARMTTPRRAQ